MSRFRTYARWLLPRLGLAFPMAIALAFLLHQFVVPEIVWQLYRAEMPHHALAQPDIDDGAGAADVHYRVMTYDCREGDILVETQLPEAEYWTIGIYDRWARAVSGGRIHHGDVSTDDGRVEVHITSDSGGGPNRLDCSSAIRGLLMYRVVGPDGPVETPTVTVQ